jgi:heat shock protein HslJ
MTTPIEPEDLRRLFDELAGGPTRAVFDEIFHRADRQRRIWRSGLIAAVVAVLAAAIVVPTVLLSRNSAPQQVIASPQPSPSRPDIRTITLAELSGYWRSIDPAASERPGFIEFVSHYRWRGSDGCNAYGGRLALSSGGRIDTTGGLGTWLLCPMTSLAPEVAWLKSAQQAQLQGNVLVLLDSQGKVLGRLEKYAPARTTIVTGTFTQVGGPAPGTSVPLSGSIQAHLNSRNGPSYVTYATAGHFTISLRPGRYYFAGITRQINGGRGPGCIVPKPRTVVAGETIHVTVVCAVP